MKQRLSILIAVLAHFWQQNRHIATGLDMEYAGPVGSDILGRTDNASLTEHPTWPLFDSETFAMSSFIFISQQL